MNKLKAFFDKKKLAVLWGPRGFSYLGFNRAGNIPYDLTFKADEVILVIPRSEVLQKEMLLSGPAVPHEDLETKIAQFLPYAPKEMAYSLAVDSTRGLLYAIPELKIKEILGQLSKSGIVVDEVVSEDQALFWSFRERAGSGAVIVLDQTDERTLFIVLKESGIILSRAYPPGEELKNILSEISFSLLEAAVKPTKVFLSGQIEIEEVVKAFEIPAERQILENYCDASLPAVLSGAKKWGSCPVISLLPNEDKIQKRTRKNKRLLKEVLAALAALVVCLCFFATTHLFLLKAKKAMLTNETARQAPTVLEVKRMTDSLAALHQAVHSKERVLVLLGELATRLPASVRLKELQIDDKSIVFQGESPSHALLTEAVQVLEKTEGVKEAKLEHARLRKRLNQDFFDFEATAQW